MSATAVTKPAIPVPLTITLAQAALVLGVILRVVQAIGVRGHTATLTAFLIKNNHDAKKPKNPYTAADIAHDLSTMRSEYLTQALVMGLLILLITAGLRMPRFAHNARWFVLLFAVFTGALTSIIPQSGLPGMARISGVLVGITSILAIVAIFTPPSMAYFRATRAAYGRPTGPAGQRGGAAGTTRPARPARGGFGGLFAPPAARQNTPDPGASGSSNNPSAGRAKAKVRTDTNAAVAKGAELARSRAKASKSKSRTTAT